MKIHPLQRVSTCCILHKWTVFAGNSVLAMQKGKLPSVTAATVIKKVVGCSLEVVLFSSFEISYHPLLFEYFSNRIVYNE